MTSHETCPYRAVQDDQRWDRAFTEGRRELFAPYDLRKPKFRFDKTSAAMTAGSCFAQNISQRLLDLGYNYVRAEHEAALSPDENRARGNDMFSARYGNIYTAQHFEQLIGGAFGTWHSVDQAWVKNGK